MSEPLAIRRKRLLYQSRYRGRLESELLLGRLRPRSWPGLTASGSIGTRRCWRRATRICSPGSPARSRCRPGTITRSLPACARFVWLTDPVLPHMPVARFGVPRA